MYRDDLFALRDRLKLEFKALSKAYDMQLGDVQELGNGATMHRIGPEGNAIRAEMRMVNLKIDGVTELIKGTSVRGAGRP